MFSALRLNCRNELMFLLRRLWGRALKSIENGRVLLHLNLILDFFHT
jgi:hypothetical protein